MTQIRTKPGNGATKLAWSKAMSVGNKTIDTEHEQIILLVNDVERAIRSRKADELSRVFARFEEAVVAHFKNEACIARALSYPFDEHHQEHQDVLGEFQIMKTELLLTENGRWSESAAEYYYSFLSEWATAHIGVDDMKLKTKLEACPYDFMPPDGPE